MNERTYGRVIALVFVVVGLVVILFPLLGRAYARYGLLFYCGLLALVLRYPFARPSRVPLLYAYFGANAFALVLHINDLASVLNAGSILVSVAAISGAAHYAVYRYGRELTDLSLEASLWFFFALSFVLSILLTLMGWPAAPEHYPWEAFYTNQRLLLISGEGVGHSPILWVTAFLSAFVLRRIFAEHRIRLLMIVLLLVLLSCLVATKSRLAFVYLAQLAIMALAYRRLSFARSMLVVFPIAFGFWFVVSSLFPGIVVQIDSLADRAQGAVGESLRVTVSKNLAGANVFAGRDVLNQTLLDASLEKPLRGQGDGAEILNFGVDVNGLVAYDPERMKAGTESILRMPVKYGWPYFLILLFFMLSLPRSYRNLGYEDEILKVGVWGMCIQSISSQGGMEVFYGNSGLFLFVFCLFLFQSLGGTRYNRGQI